MDFDLLSQSDIKQEGFVETKDATLTVGHHNVDFSIPQIDEAMETEVIEQNSPSAQKIVETINQFIENIADDYFLLGVNLSALHKLLKQSKLDTEQIKSWYAENINMPYSSAMQCKKVAEVYAESPELINRYTATGAYLLSSFNSPSERETIWQEACGPQERASIRDLRKVLKQRRDAEVLQVEDSREGTDRGYKMPESEIHEALGQLLQEAEALKNSEHEEDRKSQRKLLTKAIKSLLQRMNEHE